MSSTGRLAEPSGSSGRTLSAFEQPTLEAPASVGGGGDAAPWSPPTEFEDYVLVRLLGRGAMGSVYLAEDRVLARQVAIKFISAPGAGGEARERFLNEARAVARVQHPNVIGIHRVGELEGRPYLVTEFARGEPLDRLPVPLPWGRALAAAVDLARGLGAAHRGGVLHCDVKPQNAILTAEGAKLVDFGLARAAEGPFGEGRGEAPARGGERIIRGTPLFMAPELWRGEPPTTRSDVYGLGALLYYLLAGRCPFEEVPADGLYWYAQEHDAPALERAAPGVDPRLGAIVDRCLRRDAKERFGSGEELREALEGLARRTSVAPPAGNPYRGLRPFEADHRAVFFGRDAEAAAVLERLRAEPLVVVAGDSGVGKSSLCRAGVLPAAREGALGGGRAWAAVSFSPGERPLAALAASIAPLAGAGAAALAGATRADPAAPARALAARLGESAGALVFVDQLEELVTVSDPRERAAAAAALAELAAAGPGVRVLASLRADFLTRAAALPRLGEGLARALYLLRPLGPERVRAAVVGPAAAAGVRFESEAMVDELAAAAAHPGGLPLLQFALAGLWDARDERAGLVRRAALDALGGVGGALAAHADALLAALGPDRRAEARRLLARLVTVEGTRVRRTAPELGAGRPEARAALDALVRGRLVVAYEDEAGGAFELAHEVLVREWPTLRRWLTEDVDERAVRERLAAAAAEWARAGRPRDALWSARQLREASALGPGEAGGREGEFLRASARAVRRGRWLRAGALVAAPLAVAAAYGGALVKSRRDVARRVDALVADDRDRLAAGRAANAEAARLRAEAFRRFDAGERARGEEVWARALARTASAARELAEASRAFEAALAHDPSRADVRALLGQTLYERALLAEAAGEADQEADLAQRFALYDPTGELARRWNEPALLRLEGGAPGARASLEPAASAPRRPPPAAAPAEGAFGRPDAPRDLGPLPLAPTPLARGSYVLVLSAPGRATVRHPFVAGRGERIDLAAELPREADVPAGYAYVPPGRFLFGSAGDEEGRRNFFDTAPRHEVRTGGYLVGRTEVTFADWLAFLDASPPPERARHTPAVSTKIGLDGALQLARDPGGWRLELRTGGRTYAARAGERLAYARRARRAEHDWLRFPALGVSADDVVAYAAWLDRTGRLPGARLCTDHEWERAARGADGRGFPHGDALAPDDANFDETYGRADMGPDEVGSHPASRSPFGLDDMAGNAFEWTRSSLEPGQFVARGGTYFHDRKTAQSFNRAPAPPALRDVTSGARLCADLPPRPGPAAGR